MSSVALHRTLASLPNTGKSHARKAKYRIDMAQNEARLFAYHMRLNKAIWLLYGIADTQKSHQTLLDCS